MGMAFLVLIAYNKIPDITNRTNILGLKKTKRRKQIGHNLQNFRNNNVVISLGFLLCIID